MRTVVVAVAAVSAIAATISGCAPFGPYVYSSPYRALPAPELYGGPYAESPPTAPEPYGGPYAGSPPDSESGPYQGPPSGPYLRGRPYYQGYQGYGANGGYYGR
jgi:hypothetical protein